MPQADKRRHSEGPRGEVIKALCLQSYLPRPILVSDPYLNPAAVCRDNAESVCEPPSIRLPPLQQCSFKTLNTNQTAEEKHTTAEE